MLCVVSVGEDESDNRDAAIKMRIDDEGVCAHAQTIAKAKKKKH